MVLWYHKKADHGVSVFVLLGNRRGEWTNSLKRLNMYILIVLLSVFIINDAVAASHDNYDLRLQEIFKQNAPTKVACVSSYFISSKDVIREMKSTSRVVVVDVREAKSFASFRIPQSVNIPLFAVKTKVYLKKTKLILVNEGFNIGELEDECQNLRSMGFENTFVMHGGLKSWRDEGGQIEGDFFAMKQLDSVVPQQLVDKKNRGFWKGVALGAESPPIDGLGSPQLPFFTLQIDDHLFVKKLEKFASSQDEECHPFTVLLNDDGQGYEKIQKMISKSNAKLVYFLEGGMKGMIEFLRNQEAIFESSQKMNSKCSVCP